MDKRDERIIANIEETVPAQPTPTCPYCRESPIRLAAGAMNFQNGQIIQIVFCGNPECGKLVPFQIIGQQQPQILKPQIIARA